MELLAALVIVGLLASIAVPTVVSQRPRFDRVRCVMNLRSLGQAIHVWGGDHADQPPWRVPVADGGTGGSPLLAQGWVQWLRLSNDLASPKVLVCPSDKVKLAATEWLGSSPAPALAAPEYRSRAVSYFVGLEAAPGSPHSVLSGDRDLRTDLKSPCRLGLQSADAVLSSPSSMLAWTNALHTAGGNLLSYDGSVRRTTTAELRRAFTNSIDQGSSHLLLP